MCIPQETPPVGVKKNLGFFWVVFFAFLWYFFNAYMYRFQPAKPNEKQTTIKLYILINIGEMRLRHRARHIYVGIVVSHNRNTSLSE